MTTNMSKEKRLHVSQMLEKYGEKDPKMALLAVAVKLDAFAQVKEAIDGMVANLLKEKEDDIKT